jgi:sugar lactone lactonase YvrE
LRDFISISCVKYLKGKIAAAYAGERFHKIMKNLFTLFLLLIFAANLEAQDAAGGHFYFSGAMYQLAAEDVKIASVGSGLPFSIALTEAGAKVSPTQFDLKPSGAALGFKLKFENLKFANNDLTGAARIVNSSDSIIEGVRLDIVSVTEEFQTKDAKSVSIRNQKAKLASPLFFGDLAKNESSDAVRFDVSLIKFAPETMKITISGVVSGLRYLGAFNVENLNYPAEIDADAQGRIYICDVGGQRVVRTDADGSHAETLAKLEDQCLSAAVNPKNGDVYATRGNSTAVYQFSNVGAAKGSFDGGDYVDFLRFDRQGNLYSSGGRVFRFTNQKRSLDLKEILDESLYAKGIDVDAGGNIWIVSGLEDKRSFFRAAPDGKTAQRIASGKDWRFGHLIVPQSVRVDADGNVYVAELGEEGAAEAARISVFDKNGQFIRTFGRGGRTPEPDADKVLPGQIYRPTDIAFGKDGRVYVSGENDGGFKTNLMLVFQPF